MEIVIDDNKKKIVSERDVVIVGLLAKGKKNHEIATELKMNLRTLEAKLAKLKKSFDCNTVAHLVATFVHFKVIE